MTATAPPSAAEFLQSVAGWLFTLANRYARQFGLDRDDVFQAVTCELVRRMSRHDPARSSRTTWVALVARQVAFKMAAKERRHRHALRLDWPTVDDGDGGKDGQPLEVPGRELDPLEAAEFHDLARFALAAVAELPDGQRAAVLIRAGLADGEADSPRASAGLKRLRVTLGGCS
jgi:DNA-directed RNA polymerase specialized sigma24 family protein